MSDAEVYAARKLYQGGMTLTQVGAVVGYHGVTIAARIGIPRRPPGRRIGERPNAARDRIIVAAHERGLTLSEIGRYYGITRQCVHQIVLREKHENR